MGQAKTTTIDPRPNHPQKELDCYSADGLTGVLVTGMLMRWIKVSPRPIDSLAKLLVVLGCFSPNMMIKNIKVITISDVKAEKKSIAVW